MSATEFGTAYFEEEGHFQKIVDLNCISAFKHLCKIVHNHLLFHTLFLATLFTELLTLVVFLNSESKKISIAFVLALTLVSVFSYLVLIFYFQTKKPQQLLQLRNWFLSLCRKSMPDRLTPNAYHLSSANAASQLVDYMKGREFVFESPFNLLNRLLSKIAHWTHYDDIFLMSELLLSAAISEQVKLIKINPTDLEAHASLAITYLSLASLYKKQHDPESAALQTVKKAKKPLFEKVIGQAIEEYTILDNYAPNNPWVHAQLASCYHELGDLEKEISHYETILKMGDTDVEVLYRLGTLYFMQGQTANGLHIYESLKEHCDERAANLIENYAHFEP